MELYQLKSFVSVAESGNLTRSAREMNISLSALSTQIKSLETTLNIQLFVRGPKGVRLTKKGKVLLKKAQKVMQAAGQMVRAARELETAVSGTLNIGINTDPGFLKISDISRLMGKAYPHVSLSFIESQTVDTIKMLQSKEIDVGFHYGTMKEAAVHSIFLSTVSICIVLPEKWSKVHMDASLETISRLPWVWTRHGCPFHTALKARFDSQGLELNQVTDAVEENIVRELVKSGTGLALMRKDEALDLETQGCAAVWRGFELEIPLGVACLDSRKTEPVINGFLTGITGEF